MNTNFLDDTVVKLFEGEYDSDGLEKRLEYQAKRFAARQCQALREEILEEFLTQDDEDEEVELRGPAAASKQSKEDGKYRTVVTVVTDKKRCTKSGEEIKCERLPGHPKTIRKEIEGSRPDLTKLIESPEKLKQIFDFIEKDPDNWLQLIQNSVKN